MAAWAFLGINHQASESPASVFMFFFAEDPTNLQILSFSLSLCLSLSLSIYIYISLYIFTFLYLPVVECTCNRFRLLTRKPFLTNELIFLILGVLLVVLCIYLLRKSCSVAQTGVQRRDHGSPATSAYWV